MRGRLRGSTPGAGNQSQYVTSHQVVIIFNCLVRMMIINKIRRDNSETVRYSISYTQVLFTNNNILIIIRIRVSIDTKICDLELPQSRHYIDLYSPWRYFTQYTAAFGADCVKFTV